MPLNIPGILVPFQLLLYPRLVLPNIVVKDIRQIDFLALKKAGYRGAVFDKDNCLTIPHHDRLVPELEEAWKQCKEVFGQGNVLIVSNSAGTGLDAGGIQAESVSHHLGVPVLFHKSYKPAYSCIEGIRTYFSSRNPPITEPELIIVGDRIFTDVVLANRIHMQHRRAIQRPTAPTSSTPPDEKVLLTKEDATRSSIPLPLRPLSIWTTGVWKKESMAMRWMESKLVQTVQRYSTPPADEPSVSTEQFVKPISPPPVEKKSFVSTILRFIRVSKA